MLTVDEMIDKLLTRYEVDDIIFLLDISAEELLEMMSYKVEEKYEQVLEALDEAE